MLRRVLPSEAYGGAMGFSPWGSTLKKGVKENVEKSNGLEGFSVFIANFLL